jgi:hypothetical protein
MEQFERQENIKEVNKIQHIDTPINTSEENKNEKPYTKTKNVGMSLCLDFSIIIFVFVFYIYICILKNDRESYLDIISYISYLSIFIRIIIFGYPGDKVFLCLKTTCLMLLFFPLCRYHNPVYNFIFFWVPFNDFFRGLVIIKFLNFIYEQDILHALENNLNPDFLKIIEKYKDLSHITFKSIISFFIPRKKLLALLLMFLLLIKLSIFFYRDNNLPFEYKERLKSKKYFICANLFNNRDIIEDWTNELLKLVDYLGKDNVYISIEENGDSWDGTSEYLKSFEEQLHQKGIMCTVKTEKLVWKKDHNRISFLTTLRNKALAPMYDDSALDWYPHEYYILFFNDIVYKWQDVVKLIMTNNMEYDIACGLDYYFRFYDKWVSRDLNGIKLKNHFPYFTDRTAQYRVVNGDPVRSFACWNGLAILNAEPFTQTSFKFINNDAVMESECFLLCKQYWIKGFNRILINPNIIFTYDYYYYYMTRYLDPLYKYNLAYFYYYISFFIDDNPNSANLLDKNITMERNWMEYI